MYKSINADRWRRRASQIGSCGGWLLKTLGEGNKLNEITAVPLTFTAMPSD